MAADTLTKYIWLVDTIRRYGRITRRQINECWLRSSLSDGQPISRRTFFNYKTAVEEVFDIIIECDPSTFEYYISAQDERKESINNWLLNSAATNSVVTSSRDVADRIFLEDAPSAREHLPVAIEAIRQGVQMRFDYHPYTRSLPTRGVVLEPYFAKIFKQRWYVVGRNVKDDKIKTYALDRVSSATLLDNKFSMPASFDPAMYFQYAFGIVVDQGEPKLVRIKADHTQAKYFRALPLHHSQSEMVHDKYSVFEYRMLLTPDLISELLSYGPRIAVLEPPELRAAMADQLSRALDHYK